ncbi:PulJ/GspJ family protein [Vibrio sp. S17_S38]|uniref:PulJ/GspJ family protein n=1 Tax=Vibrio sp. S17_S38 TaxID=2720229 RepID=UPI00188C0490|nr:type II secretion system protein [Vibrio sp. S17_S38]
MMKFPQIKQAGFTLIELIITIVVMAIMIMGIAGFVELGTKGYADTVDRQQLQNQARFVVEKLTREIRHAVPNSFEKTDKCISFYPIDYAGAYAVLPTTDESTFKFVVVSGGITDPTKLNGKKLVINPSTQGDFDINSSNSIELKNVSYDKHIFSTTVDSVEFNQGTVVNSVGNRLYIYSNKVKYCIDGSQLTREFNDSGNPIQVGENLTDRSSFASGNTNDLSSDSLARSGLVHIRLYFKQNDEVTNYDSDIQVLNVP